MEPLNERLLTAWLHMSTSVINTRIVTELSYKEALVCNVLYKNLPVQQEQPLTATLLCRQTNILKSQMNRTLAALESKGLVVRERAQQDRRQVYVRFNPQRAQAYQHQHGRILELVDAITARLGETDSEEAVRLLTLMADAAAAALQSQ